MSIEIVHVYRGEEVESIHRGDIVGVDATGNVLFEYGTKDKVTYWRSSAKPFQVIPFIEAGGLERYDISEVELALMTSSHGGQNEHVSAVEGLLKKMGKTVEDLDCGASRPMHEKSYREILKANGCYTQANNPCSGKHSGMLGLGAIKGIDLHDYILPDHPIQRMMLTTVAEMTDMKEKDINVAIDGCGVPVFGLSIYNMAIAYAYLAGGEYEHPRKDILKRIASAMTAEPFYVAGTDRLDTILMEETQGRILAKLGAESVYCMSIVNKGIGIAMKTEDGAYRALDAVVPSLLKKHGYISEEEYLSINQRLPLEVKNHRKQVVGRVMSCI